MDLKGLEQEVKAAATRFYYANGDKPQRMDDLLGKAVRFLENGGTSEELRSILSKEEEK